MLKFQEQESPLISDEKRAELMQKDASADATGQDDDFLTVSSREQTVKRGTIVLAVLFIAGFAGLFLMIKKSAPVAATAAESTQEKALQAAVAQITGIKKELAGDMQTTVIDELSNVEKKQIKVSELKKNPFMLDKTAAEKTAGTSEGGSPSVEAQALAQRRMETQVNGLRLLGIMQSPTGNSCMINDRIVYKGDRLDSFEVLAINDDSVELGSQGMNFTLRIATGR
jgi:preprotein translocase subunit SecG